MHYAWWSSFALFIFLYVSLLKISLHVRYTVGITVLNVWVEFLIQTFFFRLNIYFIIYYFLLNSPQRSLSQRRESINTSVTDQFANSQVQYPIRNRSSLSGLTEDFEKGFDPDERQVRLLLKQNLKYFDTYESIDFDKLYREFQNTDRNQTGVLNRQQIEEVVYKIRIPLQRSLIFQILEKHCRAYLRLYK